MKKKILVRCITEYSKGFGNLNRCITLAEGLKRKGYKIIFLIDRKALAINEIKKKNFEYKIFKKYSRSKDEASAITNLMISNNYCSIIIDMREYGESLTKNLMNKNFEVILIDDAWCKKAYADLIINGTIVKKYHNYKKINQQSRIFVGSKYWIINKEFLKHKKKLNRIFQKDKYRIVISMGGSDPNNLSEFIANSLKTIPNLEISILAGPFFSNLTSLRKLARKKNISLIENPRKIWRKLVKGDIVLSAAGSTLYELCIMRIPTICVPIVKHQIPYAKLFSSKGFSINLGSKKRLNYAKIQNSVNFLLGNIRERKKMSKAASKIIDGKGLTRVVNEIDMFLKN